MRSILRLSAIGGIAAAIIAVFASSGSAASEEHVHFFQGVKTCAPRTNTVPEIVCVLTTSNVALLQGASVAYLRDPLVFAEPAPGRVDSDVRLTTADGSGTANGHCTFYFSTGTGLCSYRNGTGELAGFHAEFAVGTDNPKTRMYSVIGKYWLGGDGD